jgi:Arginase family
MAPLANHSVADIGDVPLSSRYDLAACHKDIEAFVTSVVAADIVPLSVGGDHSISLPLLRAVGKYRPVGMIQIDAHCHTSGSFEGCKFHHGGPFRQAVLDGLLDPERTIQIGIRGNADYLWEFSYDSGMTVIHAEEAIAMGPAAIVKRIREVTGDGPTYVTFDVDGLDPAFAPGTRNAGGRRLKLRGRLSDSEGLPRSRRGWWRRRRTRAPIRPDHQYGADRRASFIRHFVPYRSRAASSRSSDAVALSGLLWKSDQQPKTACSRLPPILRADLAGRFGPLVRRSRRGPLFAHCRRPKARFRTTAIHTRRS